MIAETAKIRIRARGLFSLIAFAGNSVLCRLALGSNQLDAASFTIIRLLSGIIMLLIISQSFNSPKRSLNKVNWLSSSALFLYAVAFSYAYLSLDTGTGALILFGAVQITMILASFVSGNRLYFSEWIGVAIAFMGFIYLVLPSVTTPSFQGFILMTISGISWGIYTIRGKSSQHPINDSTTNFLYTLPFVLTLLIVEFQNSNLSSLGIVSAMLSGAFASGVGYTAWYMAVRNLATIQASVVQLLVPILAAAGGVLFAGEMISLRLVISSIMILGGIVLVLFGKAHFR
ncbi:MAG: DMT family transporter [Cyanobacteria bacterium J06621_8]